MVSIFNLFQKWHCFNSENILHYIMSLCMQICPKMTETWISCGNTHQVGRWVLDCRFSRVPESHHLLHDRHFSSWLKPWQNSVVNIIIPIWQTSKPYPLIEEFQKATQGCAASRQESLDLSTRLSDDQVSPFSHCVFELLTGHVGLGFLIVK